jgi:hypothetical protein
MKYNALAVIFVLVLLASAAAGLPLVPSTSANPDGSFPTLSMPIEHVNYTITSINGTLWAIIDGNYPIYLQNQSDCAFNGDLPMVYPMPPGSTDIHVTLGDRELSWSNYTQSYPDALYHTAIGDWWEIYSVLPNVSGSFVLKIHYEHPLQTVNGSYLFLYDLNISSYLSGQSENSTAYFTVHIETNATNLHAYTAPPDSAASQWKPMDYTATTDGATTVVSIQMYSEDPEVSGKPLPGDLVVEFSGADQVPEFSGWIIPVLVAVVFVALLVFVKRNPVFSVLRLKKTST